MPPTYDNPEFCEYQKHQYYDSQGDFCKKCDRCMPGWELVNFEKRDFDIDPVHGALGCRHCVRCGTGFYSEHYSYENCMPCTDCQKEGRHQNRTCSPNENTLCGNLLEGRSTNNNFAAENVYLTIALLFGGILVGIVIFFIYRRFKKRRSKRTCKKKNVENDTATKNLISSDTTLSTVKTLSSSNTSSNTSSNSLSNSGKSDLSTDGNSDIINEQLTVIEKIEKWKCHHDSTEELSFPLARSISKKLAVDNTFYDIGLQLGLPEEDIKIIMSDNKYSVREQAYETLKKWKQLKASEATVLSILDVLLRLRLYDIASTLCDHYD